MDFNDENEIKKVMKILASANINFLIGAGASNPFLPLLGNIEQKINQAIEDKNIDDQVEGYKEYLKEVMLPNKCAISGTLSDNPIVNGAGAVIKNGLGLERTQKVDFDYTVSIYKNFLSTLYNLLCNRKTTVLDRQINIFTTNIDILLETALDELGIYYNDGFIGKLNPVFDLSNFRQSIIQRSTHYNNRSEIPVFNLIKLHGSTTWKYLNDDVTNNDKKIYLSSDLSHISQDLETKTGEDFIAEYKKSIVVVNPEDQKFADSVLNKYYYELLRFYSNELEKENAVLFVIGFSMADQHIREITKRAARSNPTLQIYIILYSNRNEALLNDLLETDKNTNIKIIANPNIKYNLDTITNELFTKIVTPDEN